MEGMIKVDKSPMPSSIKRAPGISASLGRLDTLPLEILHCIFAALDFQSLSRVSKTCLRGIEVVESLREYRDMIRHAPRAIAALGRTRQVCYHAASTLHNTLLSKECASCGRFGAFLFLPTCKRCCYDCLWQNPSLWVMPISAAAKCFGLPTSLVKTLPTMLSLPGNYQVRFGVSVTRRRRLVSLAAAKKLAIDHFGSEERVAGLLEVRRTAGLSSQEYFDLRWLQAAPMQPPGPEISTRVKEADTPNDSCSGVASIPFPHLSTGNKLEHGLWCKGCEHTFRLWSQNGVVPDNFSRSLDETENVRRALSAVRDRARSTTALLEHTTRCSGAQALVGKE